MVLAILLALSACTNQSDHIAAQNELEKQLVTGTVFRHVVYRKKDGTSDKRLHIYVGSDGRPWIDGRTPSTDPTPIDPLALRLMVQDAADSAYIGRPCYFGLAQDEGCNPNVWTFDRYSNTVVDSLAEVAGGLVAEGGYHEVVLIGYSGGGALVRLMAPQIPESIGLLTIAGDLDTAAWTSLHGYLPLSGSRNPAQEPPLPREQIHIQAIGGRDEVVPPPVTESYISQGQLLEVWQYPEFDHVCCWVEQWPELLARFDARLRSEDID